MSAAAAIGFNALFQQLLAPHARKPAERLMARARRESGIDELANERELEGDRRLPRYIGATDEEE